MTNCASGALLVNRREGAEEDILPFLGKVEPCDHPDGQAVRVEAEFAPRLRGRTLRLQFFRIDAVVDRPQPERVHPLPRRRQPPRPLAVRHDARRQPRANAVQQAVRAGALPDVPVLHGEENSAAARQAGRGSPRNRPSETRRREPPHRDSPAAAGTTATGMAGCAGRAASGTASPENGRASARGTECPARATPPGPARPHSRSRPRPGTFSGQARSPDEGYSAPSRRGSASR